MRYFGALAAGVAALSIASVGFVATPSLAEPYPECSSCFAPSQGGGSGSQTMAFVGIQWNFGAQAPELTGGIRYLTSDNGDLLYGVQGDVALPLQGNQPFAPIIRLVGLVGNETVQGQVGGGYDFGKSTPIVSVGAQIPYIAGGVNFGLDGTTDGFVGINSLSRPEIKDGEATCPSDSSTSFNVVDNVIEVGLNSYYVDDSLIVDGKTCLPAG